MLSFKPQSEQLIFILTTKLENSAQLNELSANIRQYFYENKSFPILTHDQKSIPKIANTEGTIYKSLQKIPFSMIYDNNFLKNEILSNSILIQKANDYICLLILHFYLSFFKTYDHSMDEVTTLLYSLLLIIHNKGNNDKYQTYAISCFTTIILEKQFSIEYSGQEFLNCMSDFFNLPAIPSESLTVLGYMLEKIGNYLDKDRELGDVLQVINFTFQKYRPLFSKQLISSIFLNLRFQFVNMSYIALSFFSQLSEILNDQDSEIYIKAFPAALIPYYERTIKTSSDPLSDIAIDFNNAYKSDNPQSIKITIPKSYKSKAPLFNQDKFSLKSINCQVFNVLLSIVKAKNRKFCNSFIEQVISTIQLQSVVRYYELLAIYLHLLIQLSPLSPDLVDSINFLFDAPYFKDPIYIENDTTTDNDSENSYFLDENVSSIRFLIMNLLLKQDYDFIQSSFNNFLQKKLIFPEFCYRCIYVYEEYKKCQLSSLLFELYSITGNRDFEEGKIACILTLKNYFNSQSLRASFFDNVNLFKYTFSFLNRNQERREFILDFLTQYFNTCHNNVNPQFLEKLIQMLGIIADDCISDMSDKNLLFIHDIIKFCTNIFIVNPTLIEGFGSFFDKVCLIVKNLSKDNKLSKSIFSQAFSMFSVHNLTLNESIAIETSAISLFGLTPTLKELIISLISADSLNQHEFIIKQPKAVVLLCKLFKDDKSIVPFLSNLCDYSPINSAYCHEAGVDAMILEKLIEIKISNDLENEKSTTTDESSSSNTNYNLEMKETVDLLLTLFYEIAHISSSINIVNRYMSLLCSNPQNNRVSDYHMMFVRLLNKLAKDAQKVPMTVFYEPQEFRNIDIFGDWTVCVWVFLTEYTNCPFITVSNGELTYEISIKNMNFALIINSSNTEYFMKCNLPLYKWVCVTFKVESTKTVLLINDEEQCSITHQSLFIHSANFLFNSSKTLCLGGMTVYNSIINENLCEKGPRLIWKDPENSLLLAVRPYLHNNQLQVEIFPKSASKDNVKNFKKSFSNMNFVDILCERCGITLILPLLAQATMKNADENLLLEALDIICNLLLFRINSQIKFGEMDGIQILSHLLTMPYSQNLIENQNSEYNQTSLNSQNSSDSQEIIDHQNSISPLLNYKVYTKLFDIYYTLVISSLKKKYLKYILVNLMIWVHSKQDDIVKITHLLASQDKEAFWTYYKLNYSLTIAAFRVYFSHIDYRNFPKFQGSEEDMYKIRQDLITFSRKFCNESISNADFLIVLSHLKCSSGLKKETDLFQYLKEIIETDYKSEKNIKPESKMMICYLMRKCIKTTVDSKTKKKQSIHFLEPQSQPPTKPRLHSTLTYEISCDFNLLIEVVELFYDSLSQHFNEKSNHITITLDNQQVTPLYQRDMIYFLMRWTPDLFSDEQYLNLLIPIVNGKYPLLFPLATMISVSLNQEALFDSFLSQIKLNPIVLEIDNLWFLWIIIGIYEFHSKVENEDEVIQGIEFLINNSLPCQWTSIFMMILDFSLIEQYVESKIPKVFLKSLSKRIDSQEKCRIFIHLSMSYMHLQKYKLKLSKNQRIIYDIDDETEEEQKRDEDKESKYYEGTLKSYQAIDNRFKSNMNFHSAIYQKNFTTHRLSNLNQKRTQLRFVSSTISHLDCDNDVESIDPKANKKPSMKTVDQLFKSIKRNISDFTLIHKNQKSDQKEDDEDDDNSNWFDLNLSKQIADLFLAFPSNEYIDDVILNEAYRIKCSPQEEKNVNSNVIQAIEPNKLSENYSISYFNKICQKFNIESPFKQEINKSHLIDNYRKRKYDVISSMTKIYEDSILPSKNVKKVFEYYIDDQNEAPNIMFQQTVQDYLASVGLRMTKSKNKWNHLCASLMRGTEAPWHLSIKQGKIHYKRDFSSCFCFCPFKIKVNKKYDQHLIASFKRNTGSQKTAEDLYERCIEKMKKKEIHNFYGDINAADISDDNQETGPDISQYIFIADCQIIKISKEIDACFKLNKDSIIVQRESKVKKYPLYSIEKILLRDHLHRPTAIEIFLYNGTSIFLNFVDILNNVVIEQITYQVISNGENFADIQIDNSTDHYFKSKKITQMWCENKISNFEYLMLLNIYSGRSFNNASQYPFMPWLILDYESKRVNPTSLRPLSKPVGALKKERLDRLIESYEEKKSCGIEPFLYSSGPMCPLAIYYWLVRCEPFTTFHIEMQDGSFDHADRVFSSWKQAIHLIMNMDDMYRELPPEAFFSHSFMTNYNEISLGINESDDAYIKDEDDVINAQSFIEHFDPSSQDVLLPPWAKNPIEFVYMNRKVLESEIVSRSIQNWIDLIWGYKQKGPEAEKAFNVFRPEIYHDIWTSPEGEDEARWPVIETYLSQVGQIPIQLFNEPHPKKTIVTMSKLSMKINEMNTQSADLITEISSSSSEILPDNESSVSNQQNMKPIKIRVDEVMSFIGAQIVTKRTSVSEAQSSFNYNLMKNEVNIMGVNDDGDVTILKIGYQLNDIEPTNVKPKKFQLTKSGRPSKSKIEKAQSTSPYVIDTSNVTYRTSDMAKKHYSLIGDIKAKKSSSLKKKFVMKFTFLDDTKIVYSDNVQNVLLFDDFNHKIETELLLNQNKVTALAFDGELNIVSVDSDGFVSVLQIYRLSPSNDSQDIHKELFSLEVLFTIPSFHENIYCCDISKDFHQVVCGSYDGFILIFSLSTQTLLRTIKLENGKRPQFIMITKSWGFILAVLTEIANGKTKTYLAVWTINGDFIRMKEIENEVACISTWRSKSGFDYFTFATPRYKVFSGEVFTLDVFFNAQVNDEVLSIGYDYDLENAIVLSKDGMVTFFHCPAPPPEF